jgi:hypothetical protein
MRGAAVSMTLRSVSSGVDPSNGGEPVLIANRILPRLNKSERWSMHRPAACSGDI